MNTLRWLRQEISRRRFRRVCGAGLTLLGAVELGMTLMIVAAPTLYGDFAGSRSLPHLVFGILLMLCGCTLLYHNR